MNLKLNDMRISTCRTLGFATMAVMMAMLGGVALLKVASLQHEFTQR